MSHGDEFVVTKSTDRLAELKKNCNDVATLNKIHELRVIGKHQSIEQKVALGESEALCINTIPDMSICS